MRSDEGIAKFVDEIIPEMEKMCKAAKGGWLMGTKDITMLDIWCGAWWEFMYMADCSTQAKDYVMFPHRLKYFKDKV